MTEKDEEFESLLAIYDEEEIDIDRVKDTVTVHVRPKTCSDSTSHHVRADLVMSLGKSYPLEPPSIEVRNVRGVDERQVDRILQSLRELAVNSSGDCMLFGIIEACKDSYTELNESAACYICMEDLNQGSSRGIISRCLHSYHTLCICNWWAQCESNEMERRKDEIPDPTKPNQLSAIGCPVCREHISEEDIESWGLSGMLKECRTKGGLLTKGESLAVVEIPPIVKKWQEEMNALAKMREARGDMTPIPTETKVGDMAFVHQYGRATTPPPVVPNEGAGTNANVPSVSKARGSSGHVDSHRPESAPATVHNARGRGRGNDRGGKRPSRGKPEPSDTRAASGKSEGISGSEDSRTTRGRGRGRGWGRGRGRGRESNASNAG